MIFFKTKQFISEIIFDMAAVKQRSAEKLFVCPIFCFNLLKRAVPIKQAIVSNISKLNGFLRYIFFPFSVGIYLNISGTDPKKKKTDQKTVNNNFFCNVEEI
jgi:hypothetical protein